jgi:putative hemolysin
MENKNSILFGILSVLLLLVAGCSQKQLIDNGGLKAPTIENENLVGIVNPASEYCIEVGGSLKSMSNDLGQYNLCILADGNEIEEWEHFRAQNSETNKQTQEEKLSMCKSWHDGCNTCFVQDGIIGGCTRMACTVETQTEPKCILYNDEKLIGKILEIKFGELHVKQGDIAYIFKTNGFDTSIYSVDDIVEIEFNKNENHDNIISTINVYVDPNKEEIAKICTREYMPVCAQTTIDGNGLPVLETFSNSCMAQDAQFIHDGECGKDSWQSAEMRICTMEYVPVCAMFNGQPKTFGNSCGAEGLELISQGECQ